MYPVDFETSVLAKLDRIIEGQQEGLQLLRQIAMTSNSSCTVEQLQELVPSKLQTIDDLLDLDARLVDADFGKKMASRIS